MVTDIVRVEVVATVAVFVAVPPGVVIVVAVVAAVVVGL